MSSSGKPYRTVDVEGWVVLVGRGAQENDTLTFHVAERSDLWLHVAGGVAGSHVVVRNPEGGTVPELVLEKAAQLAAWYSKARGAPRAEVHVCRVADVTKPKGFPPGKVQIRKFSKLFVAPSRLSDDEG